MQFDFNLEANGSQSIDVAGKFFKYKSGTGVIRVRMTSGGYVDLMPGQGVWNVEFSSITVQDKTGAANTGIVLAGWFDFRDDRITGTVDVVDGGRTRTLAGQAFMSWANLGAGAAGLNSVHQLWNPAGSGKNIVIEQIQISSPAGGFAGVAFWNLPITNLVAANGGSGTSKKNGIGTSVGQRRTEHTGVVPYAPNLFSTALAAGVNFDRKFNEPVLLTPGMGLCIFHGSTATEIAVGYEWFEELVG